MRRKLHDKVDAKTNEITALPALLRMLNLAGAVVTIDAVGYQVESTRQMQEQGADDVLGLQENQPGLYRDCADLFAWLRGPHPLDQPVVFGDDEQVDGGHGRRETRWVWSTEALAGVVSCAQWPGLASLVLVASIRQLGAESSAEQRYSLSSLPGGHRRRRQVLAPCDSDVWGDRKPRALGIGCRYGGGCQPSAEGRKCPESRLDAEAGPELMATGAICHGGHRGQTEAGKVGPRLHT
jgi:predicted transposase YbfD/YdcC